MVRKVVLPAVVALCVGVAGCSPAAYPPQQQKGVHIAGRGMKITLENVDSIDVNMPDPKGTSPLWSFLPSLLWYDSVTGTSGKLIDASQRHGD